MVIQIFQKFNLHLNRQIADFVQGQRSFTGEFEKTDFPILACSGKGSPFITEKLEYRSGNA
jgi:hypothetical protein